MMVNFDHIGIDQLRQKLAAAEAELTKRRAAAGEDLMYEDVRESVRPPIEVLDDGVWKPGRVTYSWYRRVAGQACWGCTVSGPGVGKDGSVDLTWAPNEICTELRLQGPLGKKLRDAESREAEVRRQRAEMERRAESAEAEFKLLQDEIRTLRSNKAYVDTLEKNRAETRQVLVTALGGNWGKVSDEEIEREVARRLVAFEKLDAFRQDIAKALKASSLWENLPDIVQEVKERLGDAEAERAELIATLEIFLGATPGKLSVPELQAWLVKEGEARKQLIEREFALRLFRGKVGGQFDCSTLASEATILGAIAHSKLASAADLRVLDRAHARLEVEQGEVVRLRDLLDGVAELAKMKVLAPNDSCSTAKGLTV